MSKRSLKQQSSDSKSLFGLPLTPWTIVGLLVLSCLLLFRFYDLGARPPHHDEAVNGWFLDGVFSRGYYQYDPANYHGPLFFYILGLFRLFFGRSIEALRIPIVLFSFLVTFAPLLFRKWLGNTAAWIAVAFLAVSPAMVFYSRYTIHEMEFMLASILFFYFWLRTREDSFTKPNAIGLGLSLGAMASLKENFVIYVGSLILAEIITRLYEKFFDRTREGPKLNYFSNPQQTFAGGLAVIGIAFLVITLTFSAFGRDANGIENFFRAFGLWTETGSKGNGHQKPLFYWVNLLLQLEWFAMLGLILAPLALFKMPSAVRLISVLSFGLWLGYSVVSYKTPWCVLSYYWGLILVAAYWCSTWKSRMVYAGLGLGFILSFYQAYSVAYVNVDADGHLYIYGQTYRDLMPPLNAILESAKKDPVKYETTKIQIISTFTWPLPYILGEFKHGGYYGEQNAPEVLDADYVIMDLPFEAKFASRLKGNYSREQYRARQWAAPMVFFSKKPD